MALLILIVLFSCSVNLIPQRISFQNITVKDGLPDNRVKSIIQDKNGFIWIGTLNGLCRFDGYEMRVFRHEPGNSLSLSDNRIWCLYEGKSGYIWAGTQKGELNRYNPLNHRFDSWNICGTKEEENYISCLFEDTDGSVLIGTYNKGLFRFNPADSSIENWHYTSSSSSLSNDFVNAIIRDNYGNLWAGTYSGLNRFNPAEDKNSFHRIYESVINNNLIWNLSKSVYNPDNIYICTYDGLTILNVKTGSSEKIYPVKSYGGQFSNSIGSVIEKKRGNETELWLGTYNGLVRYNLSARKYAQFLPERFNSGSLISEKINSLLLDDSGVIWIATEEGISILPGKSLRFIDDTHSGDLLFDFLYETNTIHQPGDGPVFFGTAEGLMYMKKGSLFSVPEFKNINIWSLGGYNPDSIWVGTYGKGLYLYEFNKSVINRITFDSPTGRSTPYDYVKTILHDRSGRVWVGFWGGGLGLINKNGSKKIFRKDAATISGLSFNDIWKVFQDNHDRIWIGTNGGGLNLYSEKDGGTFLKITGTDTTLLSNNILSITEQRIKQDKSKTLLWLGTTEGLFRIELRNNKNFNSIDEIIVSIRNFRRAGDLSNNSVNGIVEDNQGNLWLTTSFGISKFLPEEEKFYDFSSLDGLTGSNYDGGAIFKSNKGIIYTGCSSGINKFNPEKIKISDYQPRLLFTDLHVNNKRIVAAEDSPLKTDIAFAKEIILDYNQNTFSLHFATTDFNTPGLIEFSCLLEGFDKEWHFTSTNSATYTNINPGEYLFKFTATNNDKIWVKTPAEIKIIINPPWWRTKAAYAVYIIFIISGLFAISKFQSSRIKLQQELKMHEFEAKKHLELEQLKSRFFANLSHEFRTPLMLIKGPVEELLEENEREPGAARVTGRLRMIFRNIRKLQELIEQLLELSQLEAASIPLKSKKQNLLIPLKAFVEGFVPAAEQKDIEVIINLPDNSLCAWVDTDKFEKIINNLLSNAVKFTPEGGTILVSAGTDCSLQYAEIRIKDTGIGIPSDKLEKIFDRFYQVDNSSKRVAGGSGIGLALVKELTDLHKWKIAVNSDYGKGTEFILTIPLSDTYLRDFERIFEVSDTTAASLSSAEIVPVLLTQETSSEQSKPTLLIIEDSADVRIFLRNLLESTYNICEAENGEAGLKKAEECMPDLIISDIMMPYMDGTELCRRIKTNLETSHIPLILLTAKASEETRIEGLERGADDYLTKPFTSRELFIRIRNLLEQRKKLKEKFSREISIEPEIVTTTSVDNEFLNRVIMIAGKNLSDSEYDTEAFSRDMFVSRSQLHRKLLAITGMPPGEFLRSLRMKKAARLILEKNLSITQIAFEVGFNSPSHFTKSFQKQFNCLPSDFYEASSLNRMKSI
jgi:signal transduction histidine kinase/ligand-binding sensor domain-containing protein/DNA-binding response OmpR family regulator